jgi:RNA polymerase primary sigma factor
LIETIDSNGRGWCEDSKHRKVLEARDRLRDLENKAVLHNTRMVTNIAYRCFARQTMDLKDKCQEGIFGLMRAIELFDPTKGYQFSTYATWWIKQRIQRAIADQDSIVRSPIALLAHAIREINKEKTPKTEKELHLALMMANPPLYIDAPTPGYGLDDEDTFRINVMVDDNPGPDRLVGDKQDSLACLRANLDQREIYVLCQRFGLMDGRERTLEEIGQDLKITRERIRQIQTIALKKIRKMLG